MPLRWLLVAALTIATLGCTSPAKRRNDAFYAALYTGNAAAVEQMLAEHPELLDSEHRSRSLYAAASSDSPDAARIVRLLIQRGAKPENVEDELHLLRNSMWRDVFEILLDQASADTIDLLCLALEQQRIDILYDANFGRSSWFSCHFQNLPTPDDLEQRISLAQARRTPIGDWPPIVIKGVTGDWRLAERPFYFLDGRWFFWSRPEGELFLVSVSGGAIITFDRNLRPAATGVAWGMEPWSSPHLVEFRSNDPRLPANVRDQWQLGVAYRMHRFSPFPGSKTTATTTTIDDYRFGTGIYDNGGGLVVYPIDWFGDDFELGALPCRLADLENVEFRPVPPAADLLRQQPTASAPND